MTPDDFLKQDFNDMNFKLDPGRLEVSKVKLLIETKWYSIAILKNQHKILQLLKNSNINDDDLLDLLQENLDEYNENISKEVLETFTYISSGSKE